LPRLLSGGLRRHPPSLSRCWRTRGVATQPARRCSSPFVVWDAMVPTRVRWSHPEAACSTTASLSKIVLRLCIFSPLELVGAQRQPPTKFQPSPTEVSASPNLPRQWRPNCRDRLISKRQRIAEIHGSTRREATEKPSPKVSSGPHPAAGSRGMANRQRWLKIPRKTLALSQSPRYDQGDGNVSVGMSEHGPGCRQVITVSAGCSCAPRCDSLNQRRRARWDISRL
jgi:hypothetical protein